MNAKMLKALRRQARQKFPNLADRPQSMTRIGIRNSPYSYRGHYRVLKASVLKLVTSGAKVTLVRASR